MAKATFLASYSGPGGASGAKTHDDYLGAVEWLAQISFRRTGSRGSLMSSFPLELGGERFTLDDPRGFTWTVARVASDATAYDRKVTHVENALYRLKDEGDVTAEQVRDIDNFLALPADLKVRLYDLVSYAEGPEGARLIEETRLAAFKLSIPDALAGDHGAGLREALQAVGIEPMTAEEYRVRK